MLKSNYELQQAISKSTYKRYGQVHGLIKYALEFEKKNIALLLDIQGRLVIDLQDAAKARYEGISKLIEEEREHEREIESYLGK